VASAWSEENGKTLVALRACRPETNRGSGSDGFLKTFTVPARRLRDHTNSVVNRSDVKTNAHDSVRSWAARAKLECYGGS